MVIVSRRNIQTKYEVGQFIENLVETCLAEVILVEQEDCIHPVGVSPKRKKFTRLVSITQTYTQKHKHQKYTHHFMGLLYLSKGFSY